MSPSPTDPIVGCIERWHRHLRGELPGGLDELLHDDVVFLSPIVHTPQVGKEITTVYLTAAAGTLAPGASKSSGGATGGGTPFGYVREILDGHDALLEFETKIGDTFVNGIDLIRCDDDGRIVEFKVMLRPLRAVNLVHQQMKEAIEKLGA
jgi:hypothetical protein